MAGLVDEYTTDFGSGQVDAAAATRMPRDAVAVLLNGRINPDNSISRRDGGKRTHPTTLAVAAPETPYGGVMFRTAAGVDQILVFLDDRCHMSDDRGISWTDVTPETGGSSDLREDYYDFAIMRIGANNYLFGANGDATLWRWNGTAWDATPNAPSGAKYVEVFNNRLAVAGHNGMYVAMSAVNDPTTWAIPSGLLENVLAHGASEITGLFALGSRLMVFSEEACSTLDGYGEQTLVIAAGAAGLSRSVGCYAFRSLAAVGDDAACWLSGRGVEYYSPGTGILLLSTPVQQFIEGFDRALIRNTPGIPSACYDAPNQNYQLLLSTVGTRADRILVGNLLQRTTYQRQGFRAAFGVDQWDTAGDSADAEFLFAADADGYETDSASGLRLRVNADGAEAFASSGVGGIPIVEDADGYEDEDLNDIFPGTLFIGPSGETGTAVYSIGYDGFVRRHDGLSADDETSDGSGGSDITLRIVSRPFLFKDPRRRKRARVVHLAAIQDEGATFTAGLRVDGEQTTARTIEIAATALDQPKRGRALVSGKGDAPQVEITSTDRVRITLIGLSAELLRERLG